MSKMSLQCRNMSANLLAIIVMKVINQFTTFLYSIYDSNRFHYANGTCQLKTLEELDHTEENPAMNTFHTGYILCAVGGLIANTWLGFRTVLGIGGALMSVAIGLMCISIWSGLICQQGFYIFVWLFHPLYMGLVLPCLFYGFVRWSTGPVSRMVLVVVYYYSADATSWIKVSVAPLIMSHLHQNSLGWTATVGLLLSVAFTALSRKQKLHEIHGESEFPTTNRLIRFFKILSVFTLFAVQLNDGHVFDYQQEVLLYSSPSNFSQTELDIYLAIERFNVPRLLNMAGILSSSIVLIVTCAVRCQRRRILFLSPEHRIQVGIVIAFAVALTCFIADIILSKRGPASPILTAAIFCTAAFADGVAEILTMVALYEFVVKICPRNQWLLHVGIAVSIWSLAYYLRFGLLYITFDLILKSPTQNKSYKHCATHAMDFILLAACFVYTRFVSIRLAFPLIQDEEEELVEESSEQTPLLTFR